MHSKLAMISAATILALGSTAAFAQSQPSGQSGTSSSNSSSSTMSTQGTMPKAMSQDKVRQVMRDAGFSNVQILDATYLVRAETKDGDHILVVVNPPMMGAGAPATTGSTGGSSSGSSGSSGSSTSGTTQTAPKQ